MSAEAKQRAETTAALFQSLVGSDADGDFEAALHLLFKEREQPAGHVAWASPQRGYNHLWSEFQDHVLPRLKREPDFACRFMAVAVPPEGAPFPAPAYEMCKLVTELARYPQLRGAITDAQFTRLADATLETPMLGVFEMFARADTRLARLSIERIIRHIARAERPESKLSLLTRVVEADSKRVTESHHNNRDDDYGMTRACIANLQSARTWWRLGSGLFALPAKRRKTLGAIFKGNASLKPVEPDWMPTNYLMGNRHGSNSQCGLE